MTGKNTAVFGIYPTAEDAERGVDTLINAGFASGDISVLLPDTRSTREFAHQKETKAPEGATAGVTAGGVIGGAVGVLAGVGALAIPGLGPFIAAGPIMAGLAGLGVGGAVGGLVGALIGMGIPEYEAKRYEGRVKDGGNLLSVHCDTSDQVKRAKEILKSSGAADIASTGESAAERPADRTVAVEPPYVNDRLDAARLTPEARVVRETRAVRDPYLADPLDPVDPSAPRIRP